MRGGPGVYIDQIPQGQEYAMVFGAVNEITPAGYRAAVMPAGVERLKRYGRRTPVARAEGVGSGMLDKDYQARGAVLLSVTP